MNIIINSIMNIIMTSNRLFKYLSSLRKVIVSLHLLTNLHRQFSDKISIYFDTRNTFLKSGYTRATINKYEWHLLRAQENKRECAETK